MTTVSTPSPTVYVPAWTFADKIRKARQTTGMSQKGFALALDVNPSRYAQWEANNNLPRDLVAVAKRIEEVSGVSAVWLLGLDPRDTAPTNLCLSDSRVILGPWSTDGPSDTPQLRIAA